MLTEFLRSAVGGGPSPSVPLTDGQWESLFGDAAKHGLLGVINDVVISLPVEMLPPHGIKLGFAVMAEEIKSHNMQLCRLTSDIVDRLGGLGLECCLLKGQGMAALYPHPESRQCGDIDLWVKGSLKDTVEILRREWRVKDVFYHHASIRPSGYPVEVEVHFRPTWLNDPFANRRLQRYFTSQQNAQFANKKSDTFAIPDIGFNLVFCAVHIYRHVLFEGVGLRQVMDYFFLLRRSDEEQRRTANEILRRLKMSRFIGALMFVLGDVFGLDESFFICPPDCDSGLFLRDEIFRGGDFGRADDRNTFRGSASMLRRAAGQMKRLSRFMGIAPSEVLWAPFFKTWQFFWRRTNRF